MVTQLTAENAALRHQLAGAGQAPAAPPASASLQPPPSGSYPAPLYAYPAPFSRPSMPGMLFPQPPMFPGAPIPKVIALHSLRIVTRREGVRFRELQCPPVLLVSMRSAFCSFAAHLIPCVLHDVRALLVLTHHDSIQDCIANLLLLLPASTSTSYLICVSFASAAAANTWEIDSRPHRQAFPSYCQLVAPTMHVRPYQAAHNGPWMRTLHEDLIQTDCKLD